MQALTDLELPFLAVETASFSADPFTQFEAARQVHPWLAKTSFGYIVTEFKAMREILIHESKLTMGLTDLADMMGANGTSWGRFIADNIQGQTGETHKRLRAAVALAFTPGRLNAYRPMMRETASDLLDEWAPKGSFDFEEFVSFFPISVMCKMLGASTDQILSLRTSLEALGLAFSLDRTLVPLLNDSVDVLDDFARKLVAERRARRNSPGTVDLLDELLSATLQGKMNDEELYSLLIFLFGAGYDTSKNLLTLTMHTLLEHPDIYERCAEDQAYCRKVMNEALRYHSPGSSTRKVVDSFDFRDVHFASGTVFMMPWSALGRDPSAVSDPQAFDPDRKETHGHMAFGGGPHICLGQFIARAQIEEGLHLIAQRIKKPRLAGPFEWRLFPGVWGIRGLPISFEPAPAHETA